MVRKTRSYSTEQKNIEREIARLRKRAEALQEKQRAPAVAQILRTMREFNLTAVDIAAAFAKASRVKALNGKTSGKTTKPASTKTPMPPKYRDPVSGNTWTGRGKPPRWITAADQAGTERSRFLIGT